MSASGPFITYLIHKLSDQQDRSMAEVMTALAAELHVSVSTLAKWRNNTGNIKSTLLERLVHVGISQAHLDRAWAKNLLESGNHPDPESVLRRYFSPAQRIRHNLPKRTITYIGRKDEFAAVSERLSDPKTWIVPLIGIPGMGLGSFALDLGWRYVENYEWLPEQERFDVVIWSSAKRKRLTLSGKIIEPRDDLLRRIEDLYDVIATTLGVRDIDIKAKPLPQKKQEVTELLADAGRVLIIIDDAEFLTGVQEDDTGGQTRNGSAPSYDEEHILAFFDALPPSVKVLLTTRWQGNLPKPYFLRPLEQSEIIELIAQECEIRDITYDVLFPSTKPERLQDFIHATGGLPLVIWWGIGRIAAYGDGLYEAIRALKEAKGPLLRFIFENLLSNFSVTNINAYRTLLVLALFPNGVSLNMLATVLARQAESLHVLLQKLVELHLVIRTGEPGNERFSLMPLAVRYIEAEVATFEQKSSENQAWLMGARKRWVKAYLEFAKAHTTDVAHDWWAEYDRIDEVYATLEMVFDWASEADEEMQDCFIEFWADDCIARFTDIYEKWNERNKYLEILTDLARKRGDPLLELKSLLQRVKPLTLKYQSTDFDTISSLLAEAQAISDEHRASIPWEWQCQMAIEQGRFCERQRKFAEALKWLDEAQEAADRLPKDNYTFLRCITDILYRRGMTLYHAAREAARAGGVTDYAAAKRCLSEAERLGKTRQRQRVVHASANYLAEIALDEGDFAEAERLLDLYDEAVQRNKERRRIAGFQRSRGWLLWLRDRNSESALALLEQALKIFDIQGLGMKVEAEDVAERIHMIRSAIIAAMPDVPV